MDLKKLAPWNRFKKEEEHRAVIPVSHAMHSSRQFERSYGSFQRMLSLPDDSEHNGIIAVFKNGVLTVSIPRKKTGSRLIKNVEIKALG